MPGFYILSVLQVPDSFVRSYTIDVKWSIAEMNWYLTTTCVDVTTTQGDGGYVFFLLILVNDRVFGLPDRL